MIEYNCRFGDPETQVVLPLFRERLDGDSARGGGRSGLASVPVRFRAGAACCVVLASGGYPGAYNMGYPISLGDVAAQENVFVYHAGTRKEGETLVTSGGRVLGVTALGKDPQAARSSGLCGGGARFV